MSIKARDSLYAYLLVGTYHLAKLFGIELGGESGGADKITEHYCQLTTLRFALRLRRSFLSSTPDFGLWTLDFHRERGSTLAAERKARGIGKAALRAAGTKRACTLATELHPLRIFKLAARAAHTLPFDSQLAPALPQTNGEA